MEGNLVMKLICTVLLLLGCSNALLAAEQAVTLPSGLKYVDVKPGSGKTSKLGDTILVHYVGTLENGKVFDSSVSRNQPFEFQLGTPNIIKGWNLGLVNMKEGGTRKLIIPADLAYGKRGAGGVIPPDATLIFEVQLLKIK